MVNIIITIKIIIIIIIIKIIIITNNIRVKKYIENYYTINNFNLKFIV